MANAASENALPAAPASVKAAGGMQDGVVRKTDDATKNVATAHGSSTAFLHQGSPLVPNINAPERRNKEELPPPQQQQQQQQPGSNTKNTTTRRTTTTPTAKLPTPKDASLAHQAALHRVNNNSRATAPQSTSSSTTTPSSQPTLVRPAPAPPSSPAMKHNHHHPPHNNHPSLSQSQSPSSSLPPASSFTFPSLLASIGPDADAAIDAIAEICGRSRLSLAGEYGSHMPPQHDHGDNGGDDNGGGVEEEELPPMARMETTRRSGEERGGGVQTRGMAGRRLAMAKRKNDGVPGGGGDGVGASEATAAMSSVTSHASSARRSSRLGQQRRRGARGMDTTRPGGNYPSITLLPQVLSWLRGSTSSVGGGSEGVGEEGEDGMGSAAGTLQRLLNGNGDGEGREVRS